MNAQFPLDYYLDTFWANLRAVAYTMFHWKTRVYILETFIEHRGDFRSRAEFIGVVRGYQISDDFEVVKTYYGKFPT